VTRNDVFLEHLYKEKEIHKEHRHKHVIYKLVLTGSFFGLGQFTRNTELLNLFLYIVPFIALVHDVYITGEHLKVQRVGNFINSFESIKKSYVCIEEVIWEKYLINHREKWSYKASLLYTTIVSVFCTVAISKFNNDVVPIFYWYWLGLWGTLLTIVWIHAAEHEVRFRKIGSEGDEKLKKELEKYFKSDE